MSGDKTTTVKEIVARYLRSNPDYLERHPEILEILELRHATGPAVSLIERQVEQLRSRNADLGRQLRQLVRTAGENERLMSRLHRLTLDLLTLDDISLFFDRLCDSLREEFEADILNITLFDLEVDSNPGTPIFSARLDDPEVQQFLPHVEKGATVCGRLNRNKLEFLFDARGQWVQSTALVPIGERGLLAIGSTDPARFYPGMGTLFLDLLSEVVERRLERELPARQRRTA